MLIDMISDAYPKLSYTHIESLLMRANLSDEESSLRESITREYLTYVVDTLLSVIIRENMSVILKNIFVSGGIFSSEWIQNIFFDILSSTT